MKPDKSSYADHVDEEIADLLDALEETRLARVRLSCAGKYFRSTDSPCSVSYNAHVQFTVTDSVRAILLMEEIMNAAITEDMVVSCKQTAWELYDEGTMWMLEFEPVVPSEFFDGPGNYYYTEAWADARDWLRAAFAASVQVCRHGVWRLLTSI